MNLGLEQSCPWIWESDAFKEAEVKLESMEEVHQQLHFTPLKPHSFILVFAFQGLA